MKGVFRILFFLTIIFLTAALFIFPATKSHYDNVNGMRNIVMNRIVKEAAKAVMVEQKLDAVMDVRGVFVGGVDISDSVIAKLKLMK